MLIIYWTCSCPITLAISHSFCVRGRTADEPDRSKRIRSRTIPSGSIGKENNKPQAMSSRLSSNERIERLGTHDRDDRDGDRDGTKFCNLAEASRYFVLPLVLSRRVTLSSLRYLFPLPVGCWIDTCHIDQRQHSLITVSLRDRSGGVRSPVRTNPFLPARFVPDRKFSLPLSLAPSFSIDLR